MEIGALRHSRHLDVRVLLLWSISWWWGSHCDGVDGGVVVG